MLDYLKEQKDIVITKNRTIIARLSPFCTVEDDLALKEETLEYIYDGKRVSFEDFFEIDEKSSLRLEYLDGHIYTLSSPTINQQEISGRLYRILSKYFQKNHCRVFFAPFDVYCYKKQSHTPDVLQPDLVVACDLKSAVTEKGKYRGTPTLVMEILSDSTRSKDMTYKLNTYQLAGVEEYWIVDERQASCMVYHFEEYEIAVHIMFVKRDIALSYIFDGLSINIEELFRAL